MYLLSYKHSTEICIVVKCQLFNDLDLEKCTMLPSLGVTNHHVVNAPRRLCPWNPRSCFITYSLEYEYIVSNNHRHQRLSLATSLTGQWLKQVVVYDAEIPFS